jgi:hypothetical protein
MSGRPSTSCANVPRAIILRHAERFNVPNVVNVQESLAVGLTDKGKKDSFELGRKIRGAKQIRLFHSPALRCRQTAEAIGEGFAANGGKVLGIKETWDLCAPYLLDNIILKEADCLGHGFMRAWFDGKFHPEWIKPAPQAADMVLAPVLNALSDGGNDNLDVHVSHDWELVLLREELLRVRYEEAGWIEYLEGMEFTLNGGSFSVHNRDRSANFSFSHGHRL